MDHYGSPDENCATLKHWFTNLSLHQTHQENLLKKEMVGLQPASVSEGMEQDSRDASVADLGNTL